MQILDFSVKDYGGIQWFELKPKQIACFVGGNGKGKTTLIRAVRSVGESGSEPESINKGAEKAEIKISIRVDDGDSELYQPGIYTIHRIIRPDGFDNIVRNPRGVKMGRERQFIETFLPVLALDPVQFEEMDDEERASKLEQFLRVEVTADEIRKATSMVDPGPITEEKWADGIAAIDAVDAKLEADAKDLRVTIKNLTGSINTFEATVEGRSAEDVAGELKKTKKALEAKTKEHDAIGAELHTAQITANNVAAEAAAQAEQLANDWYTEEVSKLMDERERRRRDIQKVHQAAKDAAIDAYNSGAVNRLDPIQEEMANLRGKLETLEEKAEDAAKLAGARKQLEDWRNVKADQASQLEKVAVARGLLDRLRVAKLATVKMDQFEIRKGRLYIDGLPSSEVNTARRLMMWVQMAARFSDLHGQLMIIDEIEKLEEANRKILEDAIRAAGIQLFCARLDDAGGPLRTEETSVSVA